MKNARPRFRVPDSFLVKDAKFIKPLTIVKTMAAAIEHEGAMKTLRRLLLVLALLPGLMTGLLPLPGQAAGFDMVICGATGIETIRVDAEGNPLSDDPLSECESCCVACGSEPVHAAAGPICQPDTLARDFTGRLTVAGFDLPARTPLFPAPRGPPSEKEDLT